MELIDHLGIKPQPNPSIRSALFKCRGYCILFLLFLIAVAYNIFSVLVSSVRCLFPQQAATVKRFCSAAFWDIAIFLAVSFSLS